MSDYIIIDNFMEDPLEIRNRGVYHVCNYLDKDHHHDKETLGSFPGYRSDYINKFDSQLYAQLSFRVSKAIEILLGRDVDFSRTNNYYTYQFTDKSVNKILPDFHTDSPAPGYWGTFAGLLYLNPNPPRNSGTVFLLDGKKEYIDNKFNRFLLYRGDKIEHSISKSFGTGDKRNSRLVISTFTDLK